MFCPKSILILLQIFPLPKGDVPIIVSSYINRSDILVILNECVIRTRYTYRKIFRPYSYSWRRDMFHPSTVHVLCLIRRLLLSVIFFQSKWTVMVLLYCQCNICKICQCEAYVYQFDCLQFPVVHSQFFQYDILKFHFVCSQFFNLITPVLLITLISLIFVVKIYIMIFFTLPPPKELHWNHWR